MNKALVYATYGWLTASGVLHFSIDVASQYVRGKYWEPRVSVGFYCVLAVAAALTR